MFTDFIANENIKMLTSTSSPFNQDFLQTGIDKIGHKRSIVTPHSLNAFTVHFVMMVSTCEVQACIPLLVDQQIWEVHLPDTKVR